MNSAALLTIYISNSLKANLFLLKEYEIKMHVNFTAWFLQKYLIISTYLTYEHFHFFDMQVCQNIKLAKYHLFLGLRWKFETILSGH